MGQFSLISLLEKKNNDCIFFNERKQCEIYEVRPVQCRSYPFWEQLVQDEASWKAESLQCPGIGKGRIHSRQEIEHWLHLRRKNPPKMVM
jgi:Fe-S-cluster containining protein